MDYRSSYIHDYKDIVDPSAAVTGRRRHRRLLLLTAIPAIPALFWLNLPGLADTATGLYSQLTEALHPPPASNVSIQLPLPGTEETEAESATRAPIVRPAQVTSATPESTDKVIEAIEQPVLSETAAADRKADSPASADPEAEPSPPAPNFIAEEVIIKRGDTLSAIFDRIGLGQGELFKLLAAKGLKKRVPKLYSGQRLSFDLTPEKELHALRWQQDELTTIIIQRDGNGKFASERIEAKLDRRMASANGVIESSLFVAAVKAGLSDNMTMQMVEVLGWDIDFALDIRGGDSFSVLYEEIYAEDGSKLRDGRIQAVAFINRGREVVALRYTNPEGHVDYFSPDGHSMRKAFLRTPVKFSRISSHFSRNRMHPVLKRPRAHKGVDYVAPIGTPVKATGDGKVLFKGRKGGYGKAVILQHGGSYTTLYGHLSGYKRGLRKGRRVRQGDIIGYLGNTGRTTGPHLHYEFRINGVHRNPVKVKLPKALPLEKRYRKDFEQQTRPLMARLELMRTTQIASNEE